MRYSLATMLAFASSVAIALTLARYNPIVGGIAIATALVAVKFAAASYLHTAIIWGAALGMVLGYTIALIGVELVYATISRPTYQYIPIALEVARYATFLGAVLGGWSGFLIASNKIT